jgi:hypothetical protein
MEDTLGGYCHRLSSDFVSIKQGQILRPADRSDRA